MTKKIPRFDQYQNDLAKKQQKANEEQKIAKKKQEEALQKKEEQRRIKEKLEIISKNFKENGKKTLVQNAPFTSFVRGFFLSNMVGFMLGSLVFSMNDGKDFDDYAFGHEPLFTAHDMYGDMSYKQAIKNAYLLDDLRHGKGGLFQGICGLFTILASIIVGSNSFSNAKTANKKKTEETKELLAQFEILKDYGADVPDLIKDLKPHIKKILESLSKVDRGYFDNLISGGLDKANYEACVAIVSGYLKSHPNEYNKIIEIIDEATLPEAIKKRYGKGKTISLAAAQAMQYNK